jgi:hypothetical protein
MSLILKLAMEADVMLIIVIISKILRLIIITMGARATRAARTEYRRVTISASRKGILMSITNSGITIMRLTALAHTRPKKSERWSDVKTSVLSVTRFNEIFTMHLAYFTGLTSTNKLIMPDQKNTRTTLLHGRIKMRLPQSLDHRCKASSAGVTVAVKM